MKEDVKYVATNLRPECSELDCFACDYLDHETGHCLADEEIKDCDFCKNAFTDKRLDDDNDLSYMAIGEFENGYSVFLRASACSKPPVAIIVQMHRKDLNRNVDIAFYAPTYCPMCGRKITENEKFIKEKVTKHE